MKPLIVGVDPGSTSAVAGANLQGEIELLESGKNFPPRDIIQRIIKVGKPVVLASDKSTTPDKVEKIANSVGAKIFEPEEDLSSEKKKKLGKGTNSHELDAVASALNARRHLQRDIVKIEKFDEEYDLAKKEIALKVFKDEQIEESDETGREDDSGKSENQSYLDSNEDREKKRMENQIENLEDQVNQLKSELGEKEYEIQSLRSRIDEMREEDREEVIERREIKRREAEIREKNKEIRDLKDELKDFAIRERQYKKAVRRIFEGDSRPVPLIEGQIDFVPEEAVTSDGEILNKLEKRGSDIHRLEKVEGIELRDFVVVDELPDKNNFESILNQYREQT
jgi:predicted RNase H-like nuclease (RuvC/YqgF family)